MKKQKFYATYYDGATYDVQSEEDRGGSCVEFPTFREAKARSISNCLNDIAELKGNLKYLRSLKKSDVFKRKG